MTDTHMSNHNETWKAKKVLRVHYQGWVDYNGTSASELIKLIDHVDSYVEKGNDPNAPLFVHCRAGVGRTGTFITARELKYLHDNETEEINEENFVAWMKKLILSGRKQRGNSYVQMPEQMETILDVGNELGILQRMAEKLGSKLENWDQA